MILNTLFLENFPLFEYLKLEEALLRTSEENWCLITQGTSRALVLGLSNHVEEWINIKNFSKNSLPIIKRYSGGGAIVVGKETFLISFIFSKNFENFYFQNGKDLHLFMEKFYQKVFENFPFALKENDYTIQDQKIGGNAQYLTVKRGVHHTSFLWDFDPNDMDLLLLPKKRPAYRKDRDHEKFILPMKRLLSKPEDFVIRLKIALKSLFSAQEILLENLLSKKFPSHISLTKKISAKKVLKRELST